MPRNRAFVAASLDGFLAGPDDDLSWLSDGPAEDARALTPDAVHFDDFLRGCGAMLMGRRTYDVVAGFDGWPYGDLPVLVATRRPLVAKVPSVWAVQGDIHALLDEAAGVAGGRDVYVDGGDLIRQAMQAGRLDEVIVTQMPILLGRGVPLFAGLEARQAVRIASWTPFGSRAVQLVVVPVR